MNWPRLKARLLAEHSTSSQDCAYIEQACREAESALNVLARLGHRFYLVEGPEPAGLGWPKRMFHINYPPEGRLVYGPEWVADLGGGWYETLDEARRASGMSAQFTGRGGVKTTNLPMVIPQTN